MTTAIKRKAQVIYEKPLLVSRDTHARMRVKPQVSFEFAKELNSVVLAGVEFSQACSEFPIVFTRVGNDQVMPCAMVGLRKDENLFVDPETMQWGAGYLPAFIRRYPFILTDMPDLGLRLCVDAAYDGFNEIEGDPLFDSEGKNSAYLEQVLKLQNQFRLEFNRTALFCKKLHRLGLLTSMKATAKIEDGSEFNVNGIWVIDEKKMLGLEHQHAMQLFRTGELSWVYSHLISLNRMNRLPELLAARKRKLATQPTETT